jgi:plastocyanin
MRRRLLFSISASLLLPVAMVAFANQIARAGSPDAAPNQVKIDNFSFTPATLTVAPGTTVIWTNRDDVPHTVVSDDKTFKSKALDTDDQFSYTFTKPGTYSYFCSVHPKMTPRSWCGDPRSRRRCTLSISDRRSWPGTRNTWS